MPLAACSRLCSRDSARVGEFASCGMSSAYFSSVTVSAGYRLLLGFSRIKPFSFIRSIDVIHVYVSVYTYVYACEL